MKNRKTNRLKGYDYSQDGFYFITTCVKNRRNYFGEIINNEIILNEFGLILKKCWLMLPKMYKNCLLDEYIIMPNHFHGIIQIRNSGSLNRKHGLSEFIKEFKTKSSREINTKLKDEVFEWQKSFYDNVIRNEKALNQIRKYIIYNPLNWDKDIENLNFKGTVL